MMLRSAEADAIVVRHHIAREEPLNRLPPQPLRRPVMVDRWRQHMHGNGKRVFETTPFATRCSSQPRKRLFSLAWQIPRSYARSIDGGACKPPILLNSSSCVLPAIARGRRRGAPNFHLRRNTTMTSYELLRLLKRREAPWPQHCLPSTAPSLKKNIGAILDQRVRDLS